MKIYLFLLLLFFSFDVVHAQVLSGEITYEEKRDLHRNIPEEMSSMKSRIPEFITTSHKLIFSKDASSYSPIKNTQTNNPPPGEGGNRWMMRFASQMENEIYTDIETGMSLETREFLGKTFLIDGENTPRKWKLTGESMMVGDYFCQKATYKDENEEIFVWFTPMIPVSTGPENYNGLPGLILFVDINGEEKTLTATNIVSRPIDKKEISKPTKGEKISKEKFEEMREEKMKEMQMERGGHGMRFIMRSGE